jgi:hypothetical protein
MGFAADPPGFGDPPFTLSVRHGLTRLFLCRGGGVRATGSGVNQGDPLIPALIVKVGNPSDSSKGQADHAGHGPCMGSTRVYHVCAAIAWTEGNVEAS